MKFIVDEIPIYHQECPFYNIYSGECKLDSKEYDRCGDPAFECPHLMALPVSKCDFCIEYTPLDTNMIGPERGSFRERTRKLVGGYPNG